MPVIYTYPVKTTPVANDLILISDSADKNKTKQVTVSSIRGATVSGVSSFNTITGDITISEGNNITFTTVGKDIEINASSGSGLTVKNQGTNLTTSASSIDFVGVGVTSSTIGDDVTVNIPDAYVIEDVQLQSAVSKGTALYISGPAHGSGRPKVDIADATDNTKMPVVGLALADYQPGEGKMIVVGILDDINTSITNIPGGTLGNVVYVNNSGADNNLTGTKPIGTALIQNVGIIIKSGANGSLQVACIGRINDLPNLLENDIWLGDSNGVPSNVTNSLNNLTDASTLSSATVIGQSASGAANSTVIGNGADALSSGIAIGKDASAPANEIALNGIPSSIVETTGDTAAGDLKITINGTVYYIALRTFSP